MTQKSHFCPILALISQRCCYRVPVRIRSLPHAPRHLALGSLWVNFDLGNLMGHVGVIVVSKFTSWDGFSCCQGRVADDILVPPPKGSEGATF